MSRTGKTLTIFLIVFFLLLVSLTGIVTFFFVQEREMRQSTEQKLAISQEDRAKLNDQYKAAQQEIVILNNRLTEQDNKISGLMDELEFEKGLKEELKKENVNMKAQVDSLDSERKKFQDDVIALKEKNVFLENEIVAAKALRDQMIVKLQEAEANIKELEGKMSSATTVELEKIVVTSEEPLVQEVSAEGQILRVNAENDFVIISLGSSQGATENMTVEFYRDGVLLGEGKVTRAQTIMSAVDIVPPLSASTLQVNDQVAIKK